MCRVFYLITFPTVFITNQLILDPQKKNVLSFSINNKRLKLTKSSSNFIELSVYITSFSAVNGIVSFNFDAINIQEVPSNCK